MTVTQHVNSVFNSNTYLIQHKSYDYCCLIDIGDIDWIIEKSINIKSIFLTHTHFDHIYGINNIIERFPDCKIYTSEFGKEALYSDKLNLSKYHESPLTYKGNNIQTLFENDIVEIFPDVFLKTLSTPGHCLSCLTYYTDDYIFTGDSYIPDLKVVTNLPRGNKIQAQESIEKIKSITGTKVICPGHGEMI